METKKKRLPSGWRLHGPTGENAEHAGRAARLGEVERISGTVDQSRREAELAEKLAAAERELIELRAAAALRHSTRCAESYLQLPRRCGPSKESGGPWMCEPWIGRWPD